jgi:hypothetical protein
MPNPKQMKKLANSPLRTPRIDDPPPDGRITRRVLGRRPPGPARRREAMAARQPDAPERDPARAPPVECNRCLRCVEIQRLDAVKLFGPHALWKDVGQRLLDDG